MRIIQNCAARLVFNVPSRSHVSHLLKQLHWLPVKFRIESKICLLTYKCLNNLAPNYLTDLIEKKAPTRQLRSNNKNLLKIPKVKLEEGHQKAIIENQDLEWIYRSDIFDISFPLFKGCKSPRRRG